VAHVVSELLAGHPRVLNALSRDVADSNSNLDTKVCMKLELACVGQACAPTNFLLHKSVAKGPTQTINLHKKLKLYQGVHNESRAR
jgi:hypothetical protein